MKKLLLILGTALLAVSSAHAVSWANESFLNPQNAYGGYQQTNAAGTNSINYTNAQYGGITITNGAAAPLGGYTNVWSFGYYGQGNTNSLSLTWTNAYGKWVIPTNNTPGTVAGITFIRTPEQTPLTQDVPLWTTTTAGMNTWGQYAIYTNSVLSGSGGATAANAELSMVGDRVLTCRTYGAASASGTLNLIFVGVYNDREEESSTTVGNVAGFQWGIAAASGVSVTRTNFPIWRFVGCKAVRLRSATLTTATGANIGVTIQDLRMTGWVP